jgi:hypothetical protein
LTGFGAAKATRGHAAINLLIGPGSTISNGFVFIWSGLWIFLRGLLIFRALGNLLLRIRILDMASVE